MDQATSSVQKLEEGVAKAKIAVARAKVAAETYKLRPEHWAKIDQAEARFQNKLNMIDRLFPNRFRGKGEQLSMQFSILTLAAALFLIGSTAALWFFTREKPKRYEPYEDDEYIEE